MNTVPFATTSRFDPRQRHCWLDLSFHAEKVRLSYDDAVEWKIEIANITDHRSSSERDVVGSVYKWRASFSSNGDGFQVRIGQEGLPLRRLALNEVQTELLMKDIQFFINEAGTRT